MSIGITPDLMALSSSYATGGIAQAVSTQMLAKTLDANENAGQGVVRMIDSAAMERSVNPAVGSNFDLSV